MGPLSDEVKELISSLDIHDANNDADGANSTNNTWRKALDKQVNKPSFSTLAKFVASQRYVSTLLYYFATIQQSHFHSYYSHQFIFIDFTYYVDTAAARVGSPSTPHLLMFSRLSP